MARLTVRLLGSMQFALDGTPLTGFESDKERVFLAYLAEESQQPHRREKLAGLLWPERTEVAARNNLRRVLSNLRRLLGDRARTGAPFGCPNGCPFGCPNGCPFGCPDGPSLPSRHRTVGPPQPGLRRLDR